MYVYTLVAPFLCFFCDRVVTKMWAISEGGDRTTIGFNAQGFARVEVWSGLHGMQYTMVLSFKSLAAELANRDLHPTF